MSLNSSRIIVIVVISVFCSNIVYALDMKDCYIGRKVYVNEFIDKEAKIIDRDTYYNKVKVKLDDGTIRWVKPSLLMSEFHNAVDDYVKDQAWEFGLELLKKALQEPKQ